MESVDAVGAATLLSGRSEWIEADLLTALSRHPLDCVETEFPHFVYSVDGAEGFERPAERHPLFYGCFDWHSAVHSHWCLVRQLRLFDDHPAATDIESCLAERLMPDAAAGEVEHLEANPTFERPYGWAWLLRLAAEFALWDDGRAEDWRGVLRPLEDTVVTLVEEEFLTQSRPFRVGTHGNSAFALAAVVDYARVTGNGDLEAAAVATAEAFYREDRGYPVEYEPLGWDTVSPGLTEADLMRRVLDADAFASWFDAFLPGVAAGRPDAVLEPVAVGSEGGVALHYVGLNLSRAWCLAGLASALDGHRDVGALARSAARHAERGLADAFTDDYAGAHWLSSFVLYLLTRNEGGIAPD